VSGVVVDIACVDGSIRIEATVRTTDRTGVEMEALTAVAVAGLAVIDMVKGVDPDARMTDVEVLTKTGGVHGDWVRGQDRSP
jgi:cyclic pyranopterin phosphate synthase